MLAMFNGMKAANLGMHYEYIPKPNEWKDGRHIFFDAFLCFPQCIEAFRHCCLVLSIDDTFFAWQVYGHTIGSHFLCIDNALVPLAFALVERENKDSWG